MDVRDSRAKLENNVMVVRHEHSEGEILVRYNLKGYTDNDNQSMFFDGEFAGIDVEGEPA